MAKKIFVSYSWDNEEHKKWVARLTNDLRSKYGFEATCDTIRGDGELDTIYYIAFLRFAFPGQSNIIFFANIFNIISVVYRIIV